MQELIKKLQEMVDAGSKKSELEESIGLPKNSLAAVLSGKVGMPKKWIPKVTDFLEKPILEEVAPNREMSVKQNGEMAFTPSKDAMDRLQTTLDKINEDFGEGTIYRIGDRPMRKMDIVSTGSMGLDIALGVGGLPRGRIVEIYGNEGGGKTTIALHTIMNAQNKGGICALIDAEHAFDESYAKAIGVNTEDLYLSQPDFGEQALEELDRILSSGTYSVIVIDSVAALVPKAELEGEMGDTKMALQARIMSQAMRKIVGVTSKANTLVIFINQLRATIPQGYGYYQPTEITTGGNALKFYASVRLEVKKSAQIKDGETIIGNRVKVRVAKSKVSIPCKTAEFDIMYGEGIDMLGEIIDIATEKGVVKKSGSWFSYEGSQVGQGRLAVKDFLKDNPEILEEIKSKL